MAINLIKTELSKGEHINLVKDNGHKLSQFCVGCNWGAVIKKKFFGLMDTVVDVDLDLSCLMFDAEGKPMDHIWSPLYRFGDNKTGLPNGKLTSIDNALRHTGDDLSGDTDGDDGLDNEIITVDLQRVNSQIHSIVFFLNIYNNKEYEGDFSGIPYAHIRMFEGRPNQKPKEVFAQYNVVTKSNCSGKRALIMGKLYRSQEEWKFVAIGDAHPDSSIVHTISRVMKDYSK